MLRAVTIAASFVHNDGNHNADDDGNKDEGRDDDKDEASTGFTLEFAVFCLVDLAVAFEGLDGVHGDVNSTTWFVFNQCLSYIIL